MEPPPRIHVRFIDSLWTFVIAVAVTGPFALPLFWRNPRFSKRAKIVVSIAVILLTIVLLVLSVQLTKFMADRALDGLI